MREVLVTGGTGVVGQQAVSRLLAAGIGVRVLSRRAQPKMPAAARVVGGDLDTGEGLAAAVTGVDAILHCASATKTPFYGRARRTDVEGTDRLAAAAREAGVSHLVYISIVGIDRIPLGYYRAKRETEAVIEGSRLPFTILRTTQFHDLILDMLRQAARLPVLLAPAGFRFQPVDAGEVADRLVALTRGSPQGRVPDMGGPEIHALSHLARVYLRHTGRRRLVVSPPLPGRVARAFRAGANLCPEHPDGQITWLDFLNARRPS